MTTTHRQAVCVLDMPHRPHEWASSGGVFDCPGWRPNPEDCRDRWHRSCVADGSQCPTCDDLAPADDSGWLDDLKESR